MALRWYGKCNYETMQYSIRDEHFEALLYNRDLQPGFPHLRTMGHTEA